MYLCKLLCDNPLTQQPEAFAALALMCFHAARTDSRLNSDGEIVLLADQDRSTWDKELIATGNYYLNLSADGEHLSTYHLEAAIAYQHCIANHVEETNWLQILQYYDVLVQVQPNTMVSLNRITVVYQLYGAAKTLDEVAASPFIEEWKKHCLFHSLMAETHIQTDIKKAVYYFDKAISLTNSEAEKRLLKRKMEMALLT